MILPRFLYQNCKLVIQAYLKSDKTQKYGHAYLNELESELVGKFSHTTRRKIIRTFSLNQLLALSSFTNLENRKINELESKRNLLYWILSALYDDLLDEKLLTTEDIDQLFNDTTSFTNPNFTTKVLIKTHEDLSNICKNKNDYLSAVTAIHKAQQKSNIQFNINTSFEALVDIAILKGGTSFVLFPQFLELKNANEYSKCWYLIGVLSQMTNDLFDIYKDVKEEIYTYANKSNDCFQIKNIYQNEVEKLKTAVKQLPIHKAQQADLFYKLSVIPAFGYLAFNNLEEIQGNNKMLPNYKTIPRNKLIIDMEKPINILRLIRQAYIISKGF